MSHGILLIIGFVLSYLLTNVLQRNAQRLQLVDFPNERSSHVNPTPRGGGLIFSTLFLVLFSWLAISEDLNPMISLAFIIAASIVAGVGLLDDIHSVSARIRIVFHAVATAVLLFSVNASLGIINELWLMLFLFLSGAWLINLTNFMDGIDGLAAIEVLSVGAILLLEMMIVPGNNQLLLPVALMMSCIAGFVILNWAPAKIFMGDIGSGFIGLFFFYLILVSDISLLTWGVLLAGFWVDTTYTLLYRMFTGQRWYQAHRTHAYQKLAIRWQSHAKVSITLAAVNIVWLFPLSMIGIIFPVMKWPLVFIAIAPLLFFCIKMQAGKKLDNVNVGL